MIVAAVVLAVGVAVLAYLYGRAAGKLGADDRADAADGLAAEAATRARLEQEARVRAERAEEIAGEIRDNAPTSLPARARLDAVERWVRAHADRQRARTSPGHGAALRDPAAADPDRGTD